MSNKLFLQIVALIIIAAVVMCTMKCLQRSFCPLLKSKCAACAAKAGR
jgi:hypothetical protein